MTVSTDGIGLMAFGFCSGVWVSVFLLGLLLYMAMAISVAELMMAAITTAMGIYSAWFITANSIKKRDLTDCEPKS